MRKMLIIGALFAALPACAQQSPAEPPFDDMIRAPGEIEVYYRAIPLDPKLGNPYQGGRERVAEVARATLGLSDDAPLMRPRFGDYHWPAIVEQDGWRHIFLIAEDQFGENRAYGLEKRLSVGDAICHLAFREGAAPDGIIIDEVNLTGSIGIGNGCAPMREEFAGQMTMSPYAIDEFADEPQSGIGENVELEAGGASYRLTRQEHHPEMKRLPPLVTMATRLGDPATFSRITFVTRDDKVVDGSIQRVERRDDALPVYLVSATNLRSGSCVAIPQSGEIEDEAALLRALRTGCTSLEEAFEERRQARLRDGPPPVAVNPVIRTRPIKQD